VIKSGGIQYKDAQIQEVSVRFVGPTTAILLNRIRLVAVVGGNGRQPVQRDRGVREGGRRVATRRAVVHPADDAARTVSGGCTAVAATVLSFCIDVPQVRPQAGASSQAGPTVVTATPRAHLHAGSTLRDLLRHPAFDGFAPMILLGDRSCDEEMPLSRIGSLLPYHTQVDVDTVTSGLNRMIDDVANRQAVFYRIYDEAQRQQQPAKNNTGLFFFRGRPGAPFAVIAPGGGFSYVASVHEGFPYAAAISREGYNAFVLRYRVGSGGAPATEDLAAAVSYIFANAAMLGVSTSNYSLWGSSAGARMAASVGSHGPSRFGGADVPRPSTVVMAYTGHADQGERNRRRLSSSARMTASPCPRRWNVASARCATTAPAWSSSGIPTWGMASGSAPGRTLRDGSSKPSSSGKRRRRSVPRNRRNDPQRADYFLPTFAPIHSRIRSATCR
jgi:hypothetical protein